MDQDHTFEPLQAEPRRRRTSTGDPEPDALLRRLPSGHTSAQDSTSQSDPDTCRICRGEATQDEPLFYPCKCSGSIKYVHQDCLMEWLSHSQKKHCELCKTPFRFTKLYAPNMPKTVPFYVFISHIAKYLFRNMLGLMSQIPRSSTAMTTTSLYGINITSDNPLSNILLNMFLGTFYIGGTASRTNASANVQNIAPATVVHQPTLLSEVGFLQKISSSSPALGSFAIDILEGQIITVLVIICFILIILVRDYVVQQQPDINMRAAFAAADNVAPQENVAPAAAIPDPTEGLRPEDIDRLRGPEAPDIVFGDSPMNGDEGDGNALWTDLEELHGNGHASEIGRSTVDEYGQTPGSSEIDDVPVNELNPEHRNILDPAVDTGRPLDWEAIPDFNAPLEVQPNEGAQDAGELAQEQPQVDGLARRLADFMWRDVEAIPVHELPPLPDAADEFFDHDQDAAAVIAQDRLPELQDQEQDQEVAAAAGIDAEAEAIEDAEDLEGILELLGMRGPIAGLFQNALFCAFLVSITLFLGVFLPYNLGRLAIWLVANPARPAELASWSAMDRVWAILGGYVALSFSAALYLGRGGPISPGRVGQEWEATLIDALNQASGVMKVILIIGIEMLVFPLYCGLLLDIGLLPLFENTTIMSRVMFTVNYPLTSIFVHWFVGTGYMFHFALFVSMCRKIMRKGVLYFIRDPDDAEFHPVRDVLERNVTTQLRKILFSAFVYGALVIVCLGGVVWALSYGFQNVLPIHYSSNEPVLEFPIDLLFYNFLMPLAVKFFKPSDGLHAMYTWWFRKLARTLRLTWFLFGERKLDEEGTIQMRPPPEGHVLPLWKRLFLEVDDNEVIPKTWKGTFEGGKAKPALPLSPQELEDTNARKAALVRTHQLIPDGRFVRAPASDQVKIPKGQRVFLDVTEGNQRQDRIEQLGVDLYSTPQYQFVYVPPSFRLRIFLFILFIWIFAAATGLGFTIIPLVFGRWMFRSLIPDRIRTNDIYAFSIGIYILGSAAYFLFHLKDIYKKARKRVANTTSHILHRETLHRAAAVATRAAKLVYAYFFLLVVFPLMVASLMEFVQNPRHTVRVMQSWTIGVIYLKLAARYVVAWHRDSRVAAATRAVLRRGWLEPDVKVLTRAFVA
ncbi:putative ring finger membrane protein [Diaporthe ampelina]|uniref:RING-type E3 ubiquitin transferase n=1 Tax=Diaporthe ampelina TaxID=1214573 RepID=A0A0G2FP77_9PEZI|nr:putative ring finger membrane protein [Diaporthe ampelina]